MTPVSADRFAIQLTVDRSTRDRLNYARDLLSHCIPSGDLAAVVDQALDALIRRLERRKFAATRKPRSTRGQSTGARTIPAQVRREVWARDQGRCTFVGASGHRCAARRFLEYDHVEPVARGGRATLDGMRLRCRTHNQYAAECVFGPAFMAEKRRLARRGEEGGKAAQGPGRTDRPQDEASTQTEDLAACLSELGFHAQEIRRAVGSPEVAACSSLDERVRAGLRILCPRARRSAPLENEAARPIEERGAAALP